MGAQNVKDGVFLPLVGKNLDVMVHVIWWAKYLDARKSERLAVMGGRRRLFFGKRFRATVCRTGGCFEKKKAL